MSAFACAACGTPRASAEDAIEVLGLHEHAGDNPHGHRYRIRCFAQAANVETTTNPSSEWSWFPGYRWEVQVCRSCGALAGWRFSREGHSFYGLLLEMLG